ncbi:SufE-like protein 2, chloroplastic [Vitis vinifera]|uniref:SufE-like protein 2, chloroplastic n=1 Tax=Vitis vinifera TaxID=29760 RepID=A0A438E6B7_VITVI|nr:SufE-like protein 2, chloroplastic [Vitis vinifera]
MKNPFLKLPSSRRIPKKAILSLCHSQSLQWPTGGAWIFKEKLGIESRSDGVVAPMSPSVAHWCRAPHFLSRLPMMDLEREAEICPRRLGTGLSARSKSRTFTLPAPNMDSATLGTGYSSTLTAGFSKWRNPSPIPRSIQFVRHQQNKRNLLFKSLKCVLISHPSLAAVRLRSLASEFTGLTEPIDRVKRLLHYAELLPPFDESARVPANRVTGCTAEVWLDVRLDEFGGRAAPEEVLKMKAEDLMEMNVGVGLGVRAHSRVNAWHNILTSMQKRTEALVAERERRAEPQTQVVSG